MKPSRAVIATLSILAALEILTLATLLFNLATVHARPITQAMGPLHGAIYLAVVVIVLLAPGIRPIDRVLGCLPVIGGAVSLLRLRQSAARSDAG